MQLAAAGLGLVRLVELPEQLAQEPERVRLVLVEEVVATCPVVQAFPPAVQRYQLC